MCGWIVVIFEQHLLPPFFCIFPVYLYRNRAFYDKKIIILLLFPSKCTSII